MGGCKCSFRNCKNTTLTEAQLHFFHFPTKDRKRCEQWIINSQKPYYHSMTPEGLMNKVVCQRHFEEKYFMNSKHNRLVHNAVPTIDTDACKDIHENITLVPSNADNENESDGFTLLIEDSPDLNTTVPHTTLNIDCDQPESLSLVPIDQSTFRISNSSSPPPAKVLKLSVKQIITNMQKKAVKNFSKPLNSDQLKSNKNKQTYILSDEGEIKLIESDEETTQEHFDLTMDDIEISENNGDTCVYSVRSSQPEMKNETANDTKKISISILKNEAASFPVDTTSDFPSSPENETPLTNNRKRVIFKYLSKNINPILSIALQMDLFKDSVFSEDEKQLCMDLYSSTKDGYKVLVDTWGLKLPPIELVEKWLSENA